MVRLGVYLCGCGPNIQEAAHMDEVASYLENLDPVAHVRCFDLLCSPEGRKRLTEDIRRHRLSHVVIAACSPAEHEGSFREVLLQAGLNPYLLQMANIREQGVWVSPDRRTATRRIQKILDGAMARVLMHQPLQARRVECNADVLVVGAGVAGLSAAQLLAQAGRRVHLVEKSPALGGKAVRYQELSPRMECASCVLDPLLDQVLHSENITVLTSSELLEVLGYFGNFTAKVLRSPGFVNPDTCLGCGGCIEVCPVVVSNDYNEGLDQRKAIHIPYPGVRPNLARIDRASCLRFNGQDCGLCREACPFGSVEFGQSEEIFEIQVGAIVVAAGFEAPDPRGELHCSGGGAPELYTSMEFERMLTSDGPTAGEIRLRDGRAPRRVAVVHCDDMGQGERFCLGSMVWAKMVQQAAHRLPEAAIGAFYFRTGLPEQEAPGLFRDLAREGRLELVPMKSRDSFRIETAGGGIGMDCIDARGVRRTSSWDLMVLAQGAAPGRGASRLADILDVKLSAGGFFTGGGSLLEPVGTERDGVFAAGCAGGPKDVRSSILEGQAAAGAVLSRLRPGETLTLEPVAARIDEELCCGCRLCSGLCPFKAVTWREGQGKPEVNRLLCRGCGSCAAACPSGAIEVEHFTFLQISKEIEALVK